MNKKLLLLLCGVMSVAYAMEVQSKKVAVFSEQNGRKIQEDRFYHGIVDGGNLYAVYDGHLGESVADFLAKNFHHYFSRTSGTIRERMMQAFKNADDAKKIRKNNHCGAAAAIVFVKDNVAHFAHVGDVRALLEGNGQVVFATRDHTPDRADEYIRIEDKKGAQFADSMKSFLILSRSFGDYGFNKDIIIAEPDYEEIQLTQQYKFLVLATDGLWSVVSNQEVASILDEKWSRVKDINLLAKMLGMFAMQRNSKDNITIMLVDLLS